MVTQAEFARALLGPAAMPAGITTARGGPDAARFGVYRNNVMAGLTTALERRFAVTSRLVGAEFFRGMARAFIAGNRPRSPLLPEYGDDLPGFVESFEAAAAVPYLADIARIEALWTRAYHAADAAPLGVEAVAAIAPQTLASARLRRHPAAALVRSLWPAGSIWAAHQGAAVEPVRHRLAETVLIVRPDAEVGVHVLPARDGVFAEALLESVALGDAAERALAADAAFDFGTALVGLVGLGAFGGVV